MSDVVVFGVGDFARVAAFYLEHDSPHDVVAFTVHERYIGERELLGRPVVAYEGLAESHPPDRVDMFAAIGFSRVNRARTEIYDDARRAGYTMISYVCSRATVWPGLELGDNCFVFENNVIQPFVRIGNNVVLWSGNHIGHDSTIEDNCFIASHVVVSGNVTIGDSTFIGVNATIRDGVTIAPRSLIGAGASIMHDTVEGGVYAVKGTQPRDVRSWELENF